MSTTPSVREYLGRKGITFKEVRRGGGTELVMTCPFCNGGDKAERNTFAINAATGAWNCTRQNKCGRTGSFRSLREFFGDVDVHIQDVRHAVPRSYTKPPSGSLTELSSGARAYLLKERMLSPEILEEWGVCSCAGGRENIAFPYFRNGTLVNIKTRFRDGKDLPWKNFTQVKDAESCLYGHDKVDPETRYLIICEGEIDALTLAQYGLSNVTSLPGGVEDMRWIEVEWDWIKKFSFVYLAMDMDPAGRGAVTRIAHRLSGMCCYDVALPDKDANDCLRQGVSVDDIQGAFLSAREVRPELLKNAKELEAEVDAEMAEQARDSAPKSGLVFVDQLLRGFRPGEATVWTGRNGAGKSTLLLQLANQFILAHQERVCIASLEMLPAAYLAVMVQQVLGHRRSDKAIKTALFDHWADKLYVVNQYGSITKDSLLEVMRYAARRFEVTQFVVDSLMKIRVNGKEKLDAQAEVVQALKDFSMEERVHVHLVAHPRKGEHDDQVPDKVDVRGAGEITDLVDNVLVLHRPDEARPNAPLKAPELRIKKNRKHGEEGYSTLQYWQDRKLSEAGSPCPAWPIGSQEK